MANPVSISGNTAGSSLLLPLQYLTNVSIANAFRNIGRWFESIGSGSRSFKGFVHAGGTRATNAVTFSSFVATNTVTVNGVTLTGRATPTLVSEFTVGATDAITAQNFANVINGLGTIGNPPAKVWGVVTATVASNVVTLNFVAPGAIGNLGTLAISANGSVTGANFASGADGTITAIAKGL
jgi:hypothetical protein